MYLVTLHSPAANERIAGNIYLYLTIPLNCKIHCSHPTYDVPIDNHGHVSWSDLSQVNVQLIKTYRYAEKMVPLHGRVGVILRRAVSSIKGLGRWNEAWRPTVLQAAKLDSPSA